MKVFLPLILICFATIFWWIWWYLWSQFSQKSISWSSSWSEENGKHSINNSNSSVKKIDTLLQLQDWITDLVKTVSPSVVSIIVKKDLAIYKSDPWGFFRYRVWSINKEVGGWTGFFISDDGIIITNKHVIDDRDADYSIILNSWEELDARVIAIKKDNDLAFLQIKNSKEHTITPLQFIDSWDIQIGQFSIAIGNALSEFQNSVSLGVVSWINRSIEDNYLELNWLIQTDTAINPWNSWWPLLNLDGKVMWINTAIIDWSQNIWFAIELSQDEVDEFLEKIKDN